MAWDQKRSPVGRWVLREMKAELRIAAAPISLDEVRLWRGPQCKILDQLFRFLDAECIGRKNSSQLLAGKVVSQVKVGLYSPLL